MQRAYTFIDRERAGLRLRYWLHLPPGYWEEPARQWPLVLFLHGRGERGSDLHLLRKYGIPKVVEETQNTDYIAISPQCPLAYEWPDLTATLAHLLDQATTNLPVDGNRVYLTGLSMGARGGWLLAVDHPDRFAAIALICGRIPTPDFLSRVTVLKEKPIWIFHGAKDPVVPVENSEKIAAALQAAGGNPRLTIYRDANHDSWTLPLALLPQPERIIYGEEHGEIENLFLISPCFIKSSSFPARHHLAVHSRAVPWYTQYPTAYRCCWTYR
jgi:predicted peptidase